ncbi:nuclear transport factor 2 family protein [Microbulbifer aggregans]|uniref:nuclear transport factor 2 family protein n=1 Tax=Microbulbifer aggregans TaxID=1769779 RepID=UPI001CFEA33D|nr:nuclear transport factor 2 family protein [Microbulbifer aggregans]
MKLRSLFSAATIGLAVLLSACSGPETPQQVTETFWEAAINDDTSGVVHYSTLGAAEDYDAFSTDWQNYRPQWGRVVIDGDQASVVSRLTGFEENGPRRRKFTTYLVRQDGEWLVDYERTAMSINGGVFGSLLKKFDLYSRDLSQQLDETAAEAGTQMEQMLEEFESAGKDLSEQASEALEIYSEELRRAMEEVDESLQRSLEENSENPRRQDEAPQKEPVLI